MIVDTEFKETNLHFYSCFPFYLDTNLIITLKKLPCVCTIKFSLIFLKREIILLLIYSQFAM